MKYEVVEGQTSVIDASLLANGAAPTESMDGMSVELVLVDQSGTELELVGAATIIDEDTWRVRFTPEADDFVEGYYEGRWKVTDTFGKISYFPDGVADEWIVRKPGGTSVNSLVSTQRVAEYLGVSDPAGIAAIESHLSRAHVLAAAYIRTKSLFARTVAEKQKVLYKLDSTGSLLFRDGPVSELLSFSINDVAVELDSAGENEDIVLGYWSLKYGLGIRRNSIVRLGFTAGYTSATIPDKIAEALILTTAMLKQNPALGILSEKIGDYSVTYASDREAYQQLRGLNEKVILLLDEFRNV